MQPSFLRKTHNLTNSFFRLFSGRNIGEYQENTKRILGGWPLPKLLTAIEGTLPLQTNEQKEERGLDLSSF